MDANTRVQKSLPHVGACDANVESDNGAAMLAFWTTLTCVLHAYNSFYLCG